MTFEVIFLRTVWGETDPVCVISERVDAATEAEAKTKAFERLAYFDKPYIVGVDSVKAINP